MLIRGKRVKIMRQVAEGYCRRRECSETSDGGNFECILDHLYTSPDYSDAYIAK